MKIAVLTSSRADYSIYRPLLEKLNEDVYFELNIIAFGTHLSPNHGHTVDAIEKDGFRVSHKIPFTLSGDSPRDLVNYQADVIKHFSEIWKESDFDLIFALGDRYEMFAAVSASLPFNKKVAHLHGGETTLGAIDNAYRHSISLMSKYHFVSCDPYAEKLSELLGTLKGIFNVGALSIDNLSNFSLPSIPEMKELFKLDLNKPSILFTFHPETVSFDKNEKYIKEVIEVIEATLNYQWVITMPNADTMGNLVRKYLEDFIAKANNVFAIENFGTLGYLSVMKHCKFMLGNTSSGFVEAAYFPKYVINIGDRQKGRYRTPNIIDTPIEKAAMVQAIKKVEESPQLSYNGFYGTGSAAEKIVSLLKNQISSA